MLNRVESHVYIPLGTVTILIAGLAVNLVFFVRRACERLRQAEKIDSSQITVRYNLKIKPKYPNQHSSGLVHGVFEYSQAYRKYREE